MNTLQLLFKTSPLHYTPVRTHYYHVANEDTDINISKMSLIMKISHTPVTERMPPKLLSLCLGHPVGVTLKTSPWKNGLQLPENVTEQQGQFGQVPPENRKQIFSSVCINRNKYSFPWKCLYFLAFENIHRNTPGEEWKFVLLYKLQTPSRQPVIRLHLTHNSYLDAPPYNIT